MPELSPRTAPRLSRPGSEHERRPRFRGRIGCAAITPAPQVCCFCVAALSRKNTCTSKNYMYISLSDFSKGIAARARNPAAGCTGIFRPLNKIVVVSDFSKEFAARAPNPAELSSAGPPTSAAVQSSASPQPARGSPHNFEPRRAPRPNSYNSVSFTFCASGKAKGTVPGTPQASVLCLPSANKSTKDTATIPTRTAKPLWLNVYYNYDR